MTPTYTAENKDDGISAQVFAVEGKTQFLVRLRDDDAGEYLAPYVWFNTVEQAIAYADKCACLH
jgi:hypothetical protein